jgi:hypothetical protein
MGHTIVVSNVFLQYGTTSDYAAVTTTVDARDSFDWFESQSVSNSRGERTRLLGVRDERGHHDGKSRHGVARDLRRK